MWNNRQHSNLVALLDTPFNTESCDFPEWTNHIQSWLTGHQIQVSSCLLCFIWLLNRKRSYCGNSLVLIRVQKSFQNVPLPWSISQCLEDFLTKQTLKLPQTMRQNLPCVEPSGRSLERDIWNKNNQNSSSSKPQGEAQWWQHHARVLLLFTWNWSSGQYGGNHGSLQISICLSRNSEGLC